MRLQLFLATLPKDEGGEPRFGVEGRHVHEPGDDPLPPMPQPILFDTLSADTRPIKAARTRQRDGSRLLQRRISARKSSPREQRGMQILNFPK